MLVDLDRTDLISLLKGSDAFWVKSPVKEIAELGGKSEGGMGEKWRWDDSKINKLSDTELLGIYLLIKAENNKVCS